MSKRLADEWEFGEGQNSRPFSDTSTQIFDTSQTLSLDEDFENEEGEALTQYEELWEAYDHNFQTSANEDNLIFLDEQHFNLQGWETPPDALHEPEHAFSDSIYQGTWNLLCAGENLAWNADLYQLPEYNHVQEVDYEGPITATEEEKIDQCFGELIDTPALLLKKLPDVEAMLTSPSAVCEQINVSLTNKRLLLHLNEEEPFAALNIGMVNLLIEFLVGATIRLSAQVPYEPGVNPFRDRIKKRGTEIMLMVNLKVYGCSSVQKELGSCLSKAQLFLQDPESVEDGFEYNNPHIMDLPMPDAKDNQAIIPLEYDDPEPVEVPNFKQAMSLVFDSLSRNLCLESFEADSRVKSTLLKHQKEALHFMSQRESGPISDQFSLWKEYVKNGKVFYQHAITNTKSETKPIETGYGLLADEMGLGKSLSTLSTIARTTNQATQFMKDSLPTDPTNANVQIRSRATLVVVTTPDLIQEWTKQIDEHMTRSFIFHRYHGRNRAKKPEQLIDHDVVLTTYFTLAAEASKPNSLLHQILWYRIVLDEAHTIRQQSAKLSKAVVGLAGVYRWCLTGTPIQNSLDDLASLLSFLRPDTLEKPNNFRQYIVPRAKANTEDPYRNLRLLLDAICLRRTKEIINIPDADDRYEVLEFTSDEMTLYKQMEKNMIANIQQAVYQKSSSRKNFGQFQMQLRLRRLCNHGTFETDAANGPVLNFDGEMQKASLQQEFGARCSRCRVYLSGFDSITTPANTRFTVCGHILCPPCVVQYLDDLKQIQLQSKPRACPLCSNEIGEAVLVEMDTPRPSRQGSQVYTLSVDGFSTKISRLITDILKSESDAKSLVFSSWTTTLDLIAKAFEAHNISYRRIDGSVGLFKRQLALNAFKENADVSVLLMTTGTGAVGLNLTAANYVYIFEPQWNPAVESQAIARATRLGQTRQVNVIRYIIKDTFETSMRSQQLRKMHLAQMGWS